MKFLIIILLIAFVMVGYFSKDIWIDWFSRNSIELNTIPITIPTSTKSAIEKAIPLGKEKWISITDTVKDTSNEIDYAIESGQLELVLMLELESCNFFNFHMEDIRQISTNNYIFAQYEKMISSTSNNYFRVFNFLQSEHTYGFMEFYKPYLDDFRLHFGNEVRCSNATEIYSPSEGQVAFIGKLHEIGGYFIIIYHNFDFFKGFSIIAGLEGVNVNTHEMLTHSTLLGRTKHAYLYYSLYEIDRGFVNPIDYTIMSDYHDTIDESLTQVSVTKKISTFSFGWPVKNPIITSRFGYRDNPFRTSIREFHTGLDMINRNDRNIYSISEGEVVYTHRNHRLNGNYIVIKHFDTGIESMYLHLYKIKVKKGQYVSKDTVIGIMGNTGRSTGTHLHLSVIQNGRMIDPEKILPDLKVPFIAEMVPKLRK